MYGPMGIYLSFPVFFLFLLFSNVIFLLLLQYPQYLNFLHRRISPHFQITTFSFSTFLYLFNILLPVLKLCYYLYILSFFISSFLSPFSLVFSKCNCQAKTSCWRPVPQLVCGDFRKRTLHTASRKKLKCFSERKVICFSKKRTTGVYANLFHLQGQNKSACLCRITTTSLHSLRNI